MILPKLIDNVRMNLFTGLIERPFSGLIGHGDPLGKHPTYQFVVFCSSFSDRQHFGFIKKVDNLFTAFISQRPQKQGS